MNQFFGKLKTAIILIVLLIDPLKKVCKKSVNYGKI